MRVRMREARGLCKGCLRRWLAALGARRWPVRTGALNVPGTTPLARYSS